MIKNQYASFATRSSACGPIFLLFVISVLLYSGRSDANPVIEATEGAVSAGEQMTIVGRNFSNPNITVAFKDDAEETALVSESGKFYKLDAEQIWRSEGSPWASPLKRVSYGSTSETVYKGAGKSYNQYLSPFAGKSNNKIFISWDYKPSVSPLSQGGSNKFLRIWDDSNGKGTRISWTQMLLGYSGSAETRWGNWSGEVGKWNRMELWVDGDSGLIHASVNGETEFIFHDFEKQKKNAGLNIKLLGFDPSVSDKYPSMITYLDNIYASTSRARVALSPEPQWDDAKGYNDVLLPIEWSDTKIRTVLSTDLLTTGKPIYLYVVDRLGQANPDGYKICVRCDQTAAVGVR